MKQIGIFLILFMFTLASFAQKGKVNSANSYKEQGQLKKAWELIEESIDTVNNPKAEKAIIWPRAWEVRGNIAQAIHKDPKSKGVMDKPLFVAYDSYIKATDLDEKGKYSKSLKIDLTFLQSDLTSYAINQYNAEDYKTAFLSFEKVLEIIDHPLIKNENEEFVDTVIIYNTGLTALKAELYDDAIKYLQKSASYGYNEAATFKYVADIHKIKGDTLAALNTLKEGFEKFPTNENILVDLINIYIVAKKAGDALKYLNLAIQETPDNASFLFAKGFALESLERKDDAIASYKQAIAIDSMTFAPYYNLGALLYNRGYDQYKIAGDVPPGEPDRYDMEMEKANKMFLEALPYMERANELNPEDVSVLETLRTIYYRLKFMDKFKEIEAKLKK